MESQYYEMTHDFEEENRLFQSGYIKGYHDAIIKGTQEAVEPNKSFHLPVTVYFDYECDCGSPLMTGQPFCMKCGRPVKWE